MNNPFLDRFFVVVVVFCSVLLVCFLMGCLRVFVCLFVLLQFRILTDKMLYVISLMFLCHIHVAF